VRSAHGSVEENRVGETMMRRTTTSAIGYVHVVSTQRGGAAAAMAVQRRAIRSACAARGWTVEEMFGDTTDGSGSAPRPDLHAALAAVRIGVADALVVARLSSICRSIPEAARLLETARRQGWNVVVVDLGIDLSTGDGLAMAAMTAVFAELEHRLRRDRSQAATMRSRARGVRLGRPPALSAALRQRIRHERAAGRSLRTIAEALNADGVPTAHGGRRWHASTVRAVSDAGRP
jgi:DNA invertase Pin-like site-specific DNA recombinase